MNVDSLVEWGAKTLHYLDHPREVPDQPLDGERIEARLGWLRDCRERLTQWSALLSLAQTAEHYVRHQGWHAAAGGELRALLQPLASCAATSRLQNQLLEFADTQAAVARPGERLIGSTEVLESLIGKYKRLQALHSGHGMTRTILALGAIVSQRCLTTLRAALQHVTNRQVHDWCQQHLGLTLQARRRHAFAQEQKPRPIPALCASSF
jgi:HEAT repeat protein